MAENRKIVLKFSEKVQIVSVHEFEYFWAYTNN